MEVKDAVGKTVENLLDLNIDAFKYANDFLKNKVNYEWGAGRGTISVMS